MNGVGIGGGPRVSSIVKSLESLNYEINLICYDFYSDKFLIETEEINNLLSIITIRSPTNTSRFLKFLLLLAAIPYIWKSSRICDIILADFNNILSSIPAVFFSKIYSKPVILDCIDTKLIKIIPTVFYKHMAKNADCIFVISKYLLNVFKEDYGCKNIIYLPIFTDPNCFKVDPIARIKIRKKLNIKDQEIVIGYAGAFSKSEGVPNLLNAFKELKESHHDIKLAILGKICWPDVDDDISSLIKKFELTNEVILIPPQPHDLVPQFLSAFDILCCPKIDCEINRAANPVKVVEYLSMGKPTICSAVGGVIDVIGDKKNGILVKPGDVTDLKDKLEWTILNMKDANEIGFFGRKTIEEGYSYEILKNTIRLAIECNLKIN